MGLKANINPDHTQKGDSLRKFPIILVFFLLAACSPQTESVQKDSIKIGTRRAPDSFNPYLSLTREGELVANRLFPSLFRELPELKDGAPALTPDIVEDYSWNEEKTSVKLTLKQGLTWSDGTPLTAEDVNYSLDIRANPDVAWLDGGAQDGIQSWNIPSAYEVEVVFDRPSPFNLVRLNEGWIIPKHHFSQWEPNTWRDQDWIEGLVVYGPYKIANYQDGESLMLQAVNPGSHPDLGMAFVRDREKLYQLLIAGELDYAWGLPIDRIEDISKNLNPTIFDDLNFTYIGWNPIHPDAFSQKKPETRQDIEALFRESPHPVFGDSRVRKALTCAIQTGAYIKRFWSSRSHTLQTPWQAGLPYINNEGQTTNCGPEEARQWLEEAGWQLKDNLYHKGDQPLEFSVICNAGNLIRERYLLAIKEDLAEIGVRMNVEMLEAGLYVSRCRERQFDAMIGAFHSGTRPDLSSLYHSSETTSNGYNFTSWIGADAALEQVRDAEDLETMVTGLTELQRLFLQDQPLTMLYAGQFIGASRPTLSKITPNHLDPLFDVENWNLSK